MGTWYASTRRFYYPASRYSTGTDKFYTYSYPYFNNLGPGYRALNPASTYWDSEYNIRYWSWEMQNYEGYLYFIVHFRGAGVYPEINWEPGETFKVTVSYNLVLKEVYVYTFWNRIGGKQDWEVNDTIDCPWGSWYDVKCSEAMIKPPLSSFPLPHEVSYPNNLPFAEQHDKTTPEDEFKEVVYYIRLRQTTPVLEPIGAPAALLAQANILPSFWRKRWF